MKKTIINTMDIDGEKIERKMFIEVNYEHWKSQSFKLIVWGDYTEDFDFEGNYNTILEVEKEIKRFEKAFSEACELEVKDRKAIEALLK